MPPRSFSDRSPLSVLEKHWDNHLGGESSNEEEVKEARRGLASLVNQEKHRTSKLNQSSSEGTSASKGRSGVSPKGVTVRLDRETRDRLPNNNNTSMITRKKSNLSTSSSTSRSNGKNGKVKRSIRILIEQNTIHDVPHLDDMTPTDIANIWYDPKEYSEIKASYQLTIVRMEAALESSTDKKFSFEENDEQTFRGLEYRTQTGAWARYENKRDAYNAVLDEQDRQWKNDKDDYDSLSRVYIEHSAKCVQAAYQRAVEDASIARTICSSLYNRKPKKSSSRTRNTSPTARTNRTPRSGTKSGGSRSDSDDSTDTNRSSDLRNSNNVKKLLREQSFSRRNQIRDDISNIQQQKSTSSSSSSTKPSSRTRSTSPKKDRSISPKARSTSPKASRSTSKSAAAVIAV